MLDGGRAECAWWLGSAGITGLFAPEQEPGLPRRVATVDDEMQMRRAARQQGSSSPGRIVPTEAKPSELSGEILRAGPGGVKAKTGRLQVTRSKGDTSRRWPGVRLGAALRLLCRLPLCVDEVYRSLRLMKSSSFIEESGRPRNRRSATRPPPRNKASSTAATARMPVR